MVIVTRISIQYATNKCIRYGTKRSLQETLQTTVYTTTLNLCHAITQSKLCFKFVEASGGRVRF